jgi:hypothetical protein
VQEAWRLFHQGEFEEAVAKGLAAGGAGITAANKAEAIYANGVETRDAARVTHLEAVMKRAERRRATSRNVRMRTTSTRTPRAATASGSPS